MADIDKNQDRYFSDQSHKVLLHRNSPQKGADIW